MAEIAGVRYFQPLRFRRRDEAEGMSVDLHIAQRLLNGRHVAGNALAPRAIRLVMGMRLDAGGERPGLGVRGVTTEA